MVLSVSGACRTGKESSGAHNATWAILRGKTMLRSQEINKQIRESLSRKSDDSQLDLFIALPSDLPARDQQDLMERPFFSLSKNKRTTPIEYEVGGNYVSVTAPEKYGMATIWDADILIWAASQITEALSRGMKRNSAPKPGPCPTHSSLLRGDGNA